MGRVRGEFRRKLVLGPKISEAAFQPPLFLLIDLRKGSPIGSMSRHCSRPLFPWFSVLFSAATFRPGRCLLKSKHKAKLPGSPAPLGNFKVKKNKGLLPP
jgi:hypothetical protein